jgi:4-amino-4-deoxy-L-arabinose transferase-like glycosyltransferase
VSQGSDDRVLPARETILLLAASAALLLFRLGAAPLVGPDEPRYARVAVEMERSGDLVTPTLQGAPWLEKPILYYWLAAGSYSLLGENEWAARLPAVGGALLMVACTALLGARLYGSRVGLWAGWIAGTGLLVFAYGRAATMDMLLAGTLTAGLGLLALRRLGISGPSAAVAGGAFLGLATLAKGPLGVLLPLLVLVPHAWLTRRRASMRLVTFGAMAAFAVVALPWYVLELKAQGRAFVDTFFVNHNLERFTSTTHRHPGSILYYLPVLVAGLFPWSGLLVPAAARFDRRAPADVLLGLWVLGPLLFFSAAGAKLPGYILPVLPPLAVMMARGAVSLIDGDLEGRRWAARGAAVVGGLVALVVLGSPWLTRLPHPALRGLLAAPALWGGLLAAAGAAGLWHTPLRGLQTLRAAAIGFLFLLAMVAPTVLGAIESGRDLFEETRGREVLVLGAWRTAWMAGYFYNDGRVREAADAAAVVEAARGHRVLVLCGPAERRQLQAIPTIDVRAIAVGVRGNALVEVGRRD